MAELSSITVSGFRSLGSVQELPLRPMNVVIGANGAGKSNFIEAFKLLQTLRDGRLNEYVRKARGADKLLHFGSKVNQRIRLGISFGHGVVTAYSAELRMTDSDELCLGHESLQFDDPKLASWPTDSSLEEDEAKRRLWSALSESLKLWQIYHFHDTSPTSALRRTNEVNDNRLLRPDGSNLAAFLYFLKLKHPVEYSLVLRTVQRVAPFIEDFQLEPLRLNDQTIQLEWRHVGSDAYFDVASLSDGTLRFIALATLFLQPESLRPSIILVDEPEIGLHPAAITLLASLMRQASVKSQVIAATQSALLVDHFDPEDVLVAERHNGATTMRRLESELLRDWLEDYSLGQLWEKNELGGRPQGE